MEETSSQAPLSELQDPSNGAWSRRKVRERERERDLMRGGVYKLVVVGEQGGDGFEEALALGLGRDPVAPLEGALRGGMPLAHQLPPVHGFLVLCESSSHSDQNPAIMSSATRRAKP